MDNPLDAVGPLGHEVGVAVVGAGYWGPNLIRNFMASEASWLWTVCDLDLDRARKVVGRHTSIRITDSFDELLEDPRIEAIALATPASTHHPLAMKAIAAGKHVLIEKPLATSAAAAREIVEAGEAAGVTVMCDHTYCYTQAVDRVRSEVQTGSLGSLQYIDSVRVNLGIVQPDTNVFWDLLPHDLSIIDSVLPTGMKPLAVSATGIDPIGAGQICVGYVTIMLPGNAIAHVNVSWLSPVKIRRMTFGGSNRHLLWDDTNPAQRISIFECGVDIPQMASPEDQRERMIRYRTGDMLAPSLAEKEALGGVIADFTNSIRSGRPPLSDGHSGVRVLEILEAVEESVRLGGTLVDMSQEVASR